MQNCLFSFWNFWALSDCWASHVGGFLTVGWVWCQRWNSQWVHWSLTRLGVGLLCPDDFVGSLVSGTWSAVLAKMPRVSWAAIVLLGAEAHQHQVLGLVSPAGAGLSPGIGNCHCPGACICLPMVGIYFYLACCLIRDDPILVPSGWWMGWAWDLVTRL